MSTEGNAESIITLKNTPEMNEELRELYPGIIIPGYYANKKHWNSIKLASDEVSDEVSDDFVEKLINVTYKLVFNNLTKKQQKELLN